MTSKRGVRLYPDQYYARVKANPVALKVKTADLADNTDPARLLLLDPEQRARLEAKYEHARHELGLTEPTLEE